VNQNTGYQTMCLIIDPCKNKTDQRSSYHLRRIHMKDTEYQTGY